MVAELTGPVLPETALPAALADAARASVARYALDPEDLRELSEMLGLTESQGLTESRAPNSRTDANLVDRPYSIRFSHFSTRTSVRNAEYRSGYYLTAKRADVGLRRALDWRGAGGRRVRITMITGPYDWWSATLAEYDVTGVPHRIVPAATEGERNA